MTYGPTPDVPLEDWVFTLEHDEEELARWTWAEFTRLPQTSFQADIHCVTSWSKLDTRWRGVLVDTLFQEAGLEPPEEYVMALCHGGYDTNLAVADLVEGKAMIALEFEGEPLEDEHGGPARLVVPHLYFWKSAKWIRSLRFMESDEPGFWESNGYHMRGDPWSEERYHSD